MFKAEISGDYGIWQDFLTELTDPFRQTTMGIIENEVHQAACVVIVWTEDDSILELVKAHTYRNGSTLNVSWEDEDTGESGFVSYENGSEKMYMIANGQWRR